MYGLKKFYYPNGTVMCMQYNTYKQLQAWTYEERIKAYQNVASCYISKKQVREYFFKKYDYKCPVCGSEKDLQLHHKKWVARCAQEQDPVWEMNDEENIMVLCKKCHMPRREVDDR